MFLALAHWRTGDSGFFPEIKYYLLKALFMRVLKPVLFLCLFLNIQGCRHAGNNAAVETNDTIINMLNDFAPFSLTTDMSVLTENERKMIPLLIEIADIMDDIFWQQAFGDKQALLASLDSDQERQLAKIYYGPWARLNGNKPFIEGFDQKPLGAGFYPSDISKEEFDVLEDPRKTSQYTLIRRDSSGGLVVVPYYEAFKEQNEKASALLLEAAELAEDEGLSNYLKLRSAALLTDDYYASDMAWMDMKNNTIE